MEIPVVIVEWRFLRIRYPFFRKTHTREIVVSRRSVGGKIWFVQYDAVLVHSIVSVILDDNNVFLRNPPHENED
jgi:hypothetical protein